MNIAGKIAVGFCLSVIVSAAAGVANEYHVAARGDDAHPGTQAAPLHTIQHAAELAQSGDVIIVHEGVYRERVHPPRGGLSPQKPIVFQAAPGEKVEIKGSEVVKNWTKVQNDTWKAVVPNSLFGSFNPYSDLIHGDWFNPNHREHHTGAVYLNGEWLVEAARLDDVLLPFGVAPPRSAQSAKQVLLNVVWFRPGQGARIAASSFAAKQGTRNAPASEGGECVGWIEDGNWLRYERVDFGQRTEQVQIRAASASTGGLIEVRLDSPGGELLGSCALPNTGGWQSWTSLPVKIKPASGLKTVCLTFRSHQSPPMSGLWFAQVDHENTTIWAQFPGVDPNGQLVEINVRRSVFYPDRPGVNYITVRGFIMRQAATPWAPPTAEQVGLIGAHWSKGWVIENNVISHSICCGISLGKYGDQWDNTSANTAEGYVATIQRALKDGWSPQAIGHHLVRNNRISHCEQAGIVGSLGAVFSTISGNVIHDIHVRKLFTGAEMAGIKLHAAIDVQITGNHIYQCCRGLWLDWMAQGTRISGNLFHDNATQDLFVEVDHGPFLADNNLFLSDSSLLDVSEGGAYVHNLFCGRILSHLDLKRSTPYHPAHAVTLAGLARFQGGDDRFYNNIFVGGGEKSADERAAKDAPNVVGYGLWVYDSRKMPLHTGGNVYYNGARPYCHETNTMLRPQFDPQVQLVSQGEHACLQLVLDRSLHDATAPLVTTALLGKATVPNLPYEQPDGNPLCLNSDYFGKSRPEGHPTPGPFQNPGSGSLTLKVW